MPTARLPLASLLASRQASISRDSRSVNCLFDKSGSSYDLVKRPGLSIFNASPALPTGVGQGLFAWSGYIIAATNNHIYGIVGGVSTDFGSISSTNVPLSFTKTFDEAYMLFHDGANLYSVTKGTTTILQPLAGSIIQNISLTDGGVGYAEVPSVTFSGGGATTQATAHAEVFNGYVSNIVLDSPGVGYTSVPTITIAAPTAILSTATAHADIEFPAPWIFESPDNRAIHLRSIIVDTPGSYTSPPKVHVTLTVTTNQGNSITWDENGCSVGGATKSSFAIKATAVLANDGIYSINLDQEYYAFAGWPIVSYTCTVVIDPPSTRQATAVASNTALVQGPFASGIVYMDSYVFVLTTHGQIYQSESDNPNVWDSTRYVSSDSDPDLGVGIIRQLNYLVAFNQWSTDFFYNSGRTTGSVLDVNKQAKLEFGCANGHSIAKLEQSIIWVSNSQTQGRAVYVLDGLSPKKVSNNYVEKYLNRDTMKNVYSFCMRLAGHVLYVLTLKDSDITLVYDFDQDVWYQWTSQEGGIVTYFKYISFNGNVEYQSNLYLQHEINGQIYTMSPDYYTDDAEDIWFRSVTKIVDSGSSKRKFCTSVEVIGDKVNGNLSIRHSDDDYIRWSDYRVVDLSKTKPILYQLGSYRRRAWEVFSADACPIRLEALEVDFDIGEQGGGQEG